VSYLAYLTPGILAQSALFVAIFFGIQIIWDRDAGILTKVMVTPTPRAAIVAAKAFAAGIRGLSPVVVVIPVALLLGVGLTTNPLKILLAAVAIMLGAGFFACLSMTVAALAGTRDRLMGFGQLMTMPLFFASNALYPIEVMPAWLQVVSRVNPLSYLVDALRGLLVGTPAHLLLDLAVLTGAVVVGVAVAGALLGRLVR
jgi:ABC-2 type transport system permease protein